MSVPTEPSLRTRSPDENNEPASKKIRIAKSKSKQIQTSNGRYYYNNTAQDCLKVQGSETIFGLEDSL